MIRAPLAAAGCVLAVAVSFAQSDDAQVFRSSVDLVRIDVTVLGANRLPMHNLTADDFVVREDGEPQRIVAATEVDAVAADPTPSAWMRYAPRDVINNDLADRLGDGQAIAIVLDDDHIPSDDTNMLVSARTVARYIVDSLRPSDFAAVIFPFRPGKTQDFTNDHGRLLAAIDRLWPRDSSEYRTLQLDQGRGPIEGDVQRYSSALGRDVCLQLNPLLPALRAATARLASVPNRRKSLLLIGPGSAVRFDTGTTRCEGIWYEELRRTFRIAQRENVVIHGIDPAGYGALENYYAQPHVRNGRLQVPPSLFAARQAATAMHGFLGLVSRQTGGRAVVDSVNVEADVDRLFAETSSYYLLGYESSHGEPDGGFRKLDVHVKGRDVIVRTKPGYWTSDKADPERARDRVTARDLALVGLSVPQPLPLRTVLHPIGLRADGSVDVAAVLTVRVPTPRAPVGETLKLIRTANDLEGDLGRPVQQSIVRTVQPGAGDDTRYDVLSRFSLAPGRYEIRFNATSAIAEATGSVYADMEIPDLGRHPIAMPGIILGSADVAGRTDPLAGVLPIVPTTARAFTRNDRMTALVRVFQGGDEPVRSVAIRSRILGADSVDPLTISGALSANAFAATRSADYLLPLPFDQLPAGLHLLSVTAVLEGGRTVRRDLVFRLR